MGQMERSKIVVEGDGPDLKPFINFLVVLIPVLMLSSEFAKISIINLKMPENRGSNTETAQTVKPLAAEDDADKLMLTMIITDSVVTIGAKSGFLPSLFYKEFHEYVSAEDRRDKVTPAIRLQESDQNAVEPENRQAV